MSLSRCLGSVALFAAAEGARISRSRGAKFIAGVPVLNYQDAYEHEALVEGQTEGEWVVMLNDGTTDAQIQRMCATAVHGCNLVGHPSEGGVPFLEMRGTEEDLAAVVRSAPGAKFIEPDTTVEMIPEISAAPEAATWGLNRVRADQKSRSGGSTTIFVLDTGVRASHQDFAGRVVPTLDLTSGSVRECNGDMSCAADRQGHGTHCAGTAAGAQYGVATEASIRSVKVLSDRGSGSWSWSYAALDWMAASSIRPAVASMSLGGFGNQAAMRIAVDSAVAAGVTVVVAAGNSNSDACRFSPAFVESAITVGSTTSNDERSSFSNYGPCVNIWAPGSAVLSAGHTSDTSTRSLSGTSMACPHVSGAAALVLEANPSFLAPKVLATLQNNAFDDELTGLKANDLNKLLNVDGL